MAFSVKISGISKETGDIILKMEPPWWNADQLSEDDRFVVSNDTGSYFDYDANVSVKEMRELHEEFRLAAVTGVYGCDGWQKVINPMIQRLDEALYSQPDVYSCFHITVFEWETGLG